MYEQEELEWTCEDCEESFDEYSYVTMVTIVTAQVLTAEDGRVVDTDPRFPPKIEHLCYTCYSKKYKDPVETLRTCVKVVANVIEILDSDMAPSEAETKALDKLNQLVVYIAGVVLPPLVEIERVSQRPKRISVKYKCNKCGLSCTLGAKDSIIPEDTSITRIVSLIEDSHKIHSPNCTDFSVNSTTIELINLGG